MHTISWIAGQLGMAPGTVRAWEQRYGVVRPTRSGGGYRLYDDEDFETLRAMVGLVAGGMHPAQAAERVRSGGSSAGRRQGRSAHTLTGLPDSAVLIEASRSFDVRAVEDCLDAAFAAAQFEYVIDVWLTAALAELGRAWADGDLDIAQEHFISAAVMRRLAAAFDAAGHARGGPRVVAGLAPGAIHEIATLAFATMLRRAGVRVTYLGASLPIQSWVRSVRAIRPDAVVVGAPRTSDAQAAAEVANALREAEPSTAVYVGGAGAGADRIPDGTTLAEAANWLADALVEVPARSGVSG